MTVVIGGSQFVSQYVRHAHSGTTGRCVATEADGRLIVWRTRSETGNLTIERWDEKDADLAAVQPLRRVSA